MSTSKIVWPEKTGELYHNHFDSTIWNDFSFRDDDIIVATYAKSGTTWLQQVVGQLMFAGAREAGSRMRALAGNRRNLTVTKLGSTAAEQPRPPQCCRTAPCYLTIKSGNIGRIRFDIRIG